MKDPETGDYDSPASRRRLPNGYADEQSPQFIERPLRSYYSTVTVPAVTGTRTDQHTRILDAACNWCASDLKKRGGHVPE